MNLKKLFKGEERTVKAKKNIAASILIKGVDSLVYFLLVPVTLGYLNPYEYGIWLTLSSILMWINSFDVGLGNGMRNKLAEAIANNDKALARAYVSTTFLMLIIIMGSLIILGSLIGPFINWYDILGTSQDKVHHLLEIIYLSFVIFCINFIFKFIGNVYLGMQLPAINNLMVVSGHILSLLVIYILTLTTRGNLLLVAIVYSSSPLIIYLISYPITFKKIFPFLSPSIKFFKRKYLSDLLNIGVQFFVLQISGILLFAFSNLLISHMFGPEHVTPYSIAYRYFSVMLMVSNLIMAPMWTATTDAYTKGDFGWIRKTRSTVHKFLLLATLGLFLMVILSKFVYSIWIDNRVQIPLKLSILIAVYVCILMWSLSYSSFINGTGKLRMQTIMTFTIAILFIPICYLLGKPFGVAGVVTGMCILNLITLFSNKIQFDLILNKRANGVWDK
ncbi:MAG: MATE family efflux transporter [Bacteroides sp.]|nr:MATE family efflux transporter [Bacteroides sp.]